MKKAASTRDAVDEPLDGHLVALDVVAEDLDASGVERQQRADEPDERRLAAAVGAEDPVHLAALDAQRDVVHGDDGLLLAADHEPLGDVVDEQRRHAPRPALGGGPFAAGRGRTGRAGRLVVGVGSRVVTTIVLPDGLVPAVPA